MKILALETSGHRGSVALIEGLCPSELHQVLPELHQVPPKAHTVPVDQDVLLTQPRPFPADVRLAAYLRHEAFNEHAERLWGLLDAVLEQAQWSRSEIDRVAIGIGPGSFAGVRVAVSMAQGLMLGLNISGVGVGSLRAIAASLPESDQRVRVVLRDAHRAEFFVAAYASDGCELVAPHAIEQAGSGEYLHTKIVQPLGLSSYIVLGAEIEGHPCEINEEMSEPDARQVGRLALLLDPMAHPIQPCYVRGPNVVRPQLPPSPLSFPRL